MKKIISLLLILTLVFTFTACSKENVQAGSNNDGETLKLRVANVTQIDHPMNKSCEVFAEKINEKSNGRIQITNFPARQLGDDRELFEQVQQGALDMALISAGPVGSTTPLATALQLPFLFDSWDQWLEAMNSEAADNLFAGFDVYNVKALAAYNSGFRHTLTVDKPVNTPNDYTGLKFRVAETPLHVDIFRNLGASPTPIAYGEIYTSLQNKVIDGLEMDYPAMVMEKHFEVAKNVTASGHFTWPGIFMVNLNLWNSLSAEDQQMFIEVSKEVYEENVKYVQEQETKAIGELTKAGVSIIELTSEQKQSFIDATKDVIEKYTSQDPAIKAFYDYANSLKK
ncbi:MAG TPA: hypothetical protein DHU59_02795 [Clostridiales bacterium]|nr:hypothetical protein [Clostridiales bacterium]